MTSQGVVSSRCAPASGEPASQDEYRAKAKAWAGRVGLSELPGVAEAPFLGEGGGPSGR